MSLPTPDVVTEKEVRQLLKRLVWLKKNWPQEPALRDLSPQMVETLLNYSAKQNRKTMYCVNTAVGLIAIMASAQTFIPLQKTIAIEAVFMICGLILLMPMTRKRINNIYALTMTSDLRVLPTLVQATNYSGGEHPDIAAAITRLLPLVTEDHAGLLNRKAQESLWHLAIAPLIFKHECDEALACGALHAFTCIGSRDTLNRMRNVIRPRWLAPSHRRVYDALRQAIPLMEARLKRQEVPETLLRAAAMPASHSETLLRPAHTVTPELPEQLLRAGTDRQEE